MTEYLAIDWGTTNRRVYRLDADGTVLATERDDTGILAVASGGFPAEIAAIRTKMGDLPVIIAGMAGSDRGWVEVPYVPAPCGVAELASGLHWIEPGRTAIVPGVQWSGPDRVDVMRGEEVQLLGAVEAGLAPPDALLCQPGTHCKWAWMVSGRIERFATAMTGEMFALLQRHSLLASLIGGPVMANASFLAGVAESRDFDLLSRLFSIRADHVSRSGRIADPASYASGLLIGADAGARLKAGGPDVFVLADEALGGLYVAAIEALGAAARRVDSHNAFASGIHAIWSNQ